MKHFVKYGLYPSLLFSIILACALTLYFDWDLGTTSFVIAVIRFPSLLLLEFLLPAKQEWKMTWSSFFRDIKYGIAGYFVLKGCKYLIHISILKWAEGNEGIVANAPIVVGFIVTALVYEFLQYWHHRASHELSGKFGSFLWKTHVAHHLPEKVYILMHPVFHPINALITMVIIQGNLALMGASSESLFILQVLMSFHGQISHFNVDIKAGWLNYIFIGTELHRNHHSANMEEAKNYGSLLSIWDIVFGTFCYTPNKLPERLGVAEPENYPKSTEIFKVMWLPFKWEKKK